jgi:hypothetical protein
VTPPKSGQRSSKSWEDSRDDDDDDGLLQPYHHQVCMKATCTVQSDRRMTASHCIGDRGRQEADLSIRTCRVSEGSTMFNSKAAYSNETYKRSSDSGHYSSDAAIHNNQHRALRFAPLLSVTFRTRHVPNKHKS